MCSLPSSRSASSSRLGPEIADHLGVREIHLLDVSGRVADVDHLGAAGPMMNGGFSIVSWPMAMIRSAASIASCT